MRNPVRRSILLGAAAVGAGLYLTSKNRERFSSVSTVRASEAERKSRRAKRTLPTRSNQLESLKTESFDILIVGGGATGAGCALDAVTRGLKTALVEADDFASGTSSRSTKLIHGGVRYLQKAIMNFDIDQYNMVKEALHERSNMLEVAPHLTRPLPIMLPVYKWWQVPYYWFGIKMYDFVAGSKTVKSSYYLSKSGALELFPMLRGDKLCGAIVYYDGQQDDARMCLSIALTATRHGATVANHVSCLKLLKEKDDTGREVISGARLRDELTGSEWDVKAKCVINATGPFTDTIRKLDDPDARNICSPSSGVHIVLPEYYSPQQTGLLDPSTSDGRVIFFLPWQKGTIAGTTDLPCEVTHSPKPTEKEILFILSEIKNYLNPDVEVRRGDVLSAWSGIRPLVSDPNKADTQSIARNHIVHSSKSNLVTIAGGKWTTYRAMAEETVNEAIRVAKLEPVHKECQTEGLLIEGAHGWTPTMYIRLVQDFGLEVDVAQHLAHSYGDRAFAVAKMAGMTGKRWPIIGNKLHPEFPYIEAEVRYGVREYACTAVDIVARRIRLAFLNVEAAQEALPRVIDIMGEELGWDEKEKEKQFKTATEFLQNEMGSSVNRASKDKTPINLDESEIELYVKRFEIMDKGNKGYVSVNDIRRSLKRSGEHVKTDELHEILREIDSNRNGKIELDEYLQMMSAIKSGAIAHSRFARMAEMEMEHHEREKLKRKITVERSGGGVSGIRKMKRSKSSNPILVSRSSQTLVKQRSFMKNEKDNRSSQGDTPDFKLEQLYKEAKESFENGEYENALMKFSHGAKIDPNNMDFTLGVRKSKNAIVNDLTNSKDLLQELHDEITRYPVTKNLKEEIPLFPPEGKAPSTKIKKTESENDIPVMSDMKSEAMKAAITKTRGTKLEPTYNLTINDGSCYKTITATAQDVKEYLKDKNYFKIKDQTKKDWKKLRSEFNKKLAEKEAAQRYAKEAKFLEERSNIRQHCEEQVSLIGRHYQNGKMADVIRFSENFIKYLNKKTDKMLPRKWIYIATAFNYLARANAEQGDFEKSKTFGEKLYRIAITSNKPELIAQSYILSGKIYVKFNKYKEAAFVWEKLIPLLTDDEKKAWLFHEIGRCYFEMEKYDTSFKHGTESAHWAGKCSSSTWICAANVLLGQIEMKRNNYDKALKNFTEAKKHAEISDDDQTLNYINSVQEILNVILSRSRNKFADDNENTGSVNGNVSLAEDEK